MKPSSSLLAFSFCSLAACLVGCAADATSAVEPTGSSVSALSAADDVFPVLPPVPQGNATHDQVCAADQSHVKADWLAWLARTGKKQGSLVQDGPNHYTCKACDMDNWNFQDWPEDVYQIEDSYVANAMFISLNVDGAPGGSTYHLKNVFAYGSEINEHVNITAENVDLRCGWIRKGAHITASNGLDVSGVDSDLLSITASKDVRISGIVLDPKYGGVELQDIEGGRIQTSAPVKLAGTMKGSWIFDGTQNLDLRPSGAVTFDAATLSFAGASGKIGITGATVTMNGGAIVGSTGGVRVSDVTAGTLRITGGAAWPVGKTALVADTSIASLDLGGAKLVTPKGEIWPAPDADLQHLRLAHGALPDGADLTTAKLADAHLERVDMRNVTISKVVGGKTTAADFSSTHLAQATLDQQSIDGVRFARADLRGAKLVRVHGKADFSFATAGVLPPHTDDNDTDTPKVTSFEEAHLADSTLTGIQIQGASFARAQLADVVFDEATDATGTDFTGAFFARTSDAGVLLPNTTFGRVSHLHGVKLDGADLRNVDLHGADLRTVDAKRSTLIGAFLCGANIANAKLGGADLTNAYADVTGNVTFPDGKKGACAAANRSNADTAPTSGTTTECPSGGAGHDATGACKDDQWKLQGDPASTCTNPGTVMSGFPCQLDCECQSFQCGAGGKCT